MQNQPSIVECKFSMAAIGGMKIFLGVRFFTYIAILSAKTLSPPKHMIVQCRKKAFPHIKPAWSDDELNTRCKPKVNDTALAIEKLGKNDVRPSTRTETPYSGTTETLPMSLMHSYSKVVVKTKRTNRFRTQNQTIGEPK